MAWGISYVKKRTLAYTFYFIKLLKLQYIKRNPEHGYFNNQQLDVPAARQGRRDGD
jgi:hypothetical protein